MVFPHEIPVNFDSLKAEIKTGGEHKEGKRPYSQDGKMDERKIISRYTVRGLQ